MNAKCLDCGSPAVMRKNGTTGVHFLGCSAFPECKWSKSVYLPEKGGRSDDCWTDPSDDDCEYCFDDTANPLSIW